MLDPLKPYMKAIVLLALILATALADGLGLELGLDVEHYVALLLADVAVWAVPNRDPDRGSANENLTRHVGR